MPSRRETPGIKNLPDGRYQVDFLTKDGKRPRRICNTKKSANDMLHRMKAADLEDRLPKKPDQNFSFSELAGRMLESKKGKVADRTYRTSEIRLGIVLNESQLGSMPLHEINEEHIERALNTIKERRELEASTANRYRVAIGSVFTYGIRKHKIPMLHPVKEVEPYLEDDPRERYLAEDEEIAVLREMAESCPEREPEFAVALYTGMRREEQFYLEWKDVDLGRRVLTIRGEISKTRTHRVPLHLPCVEAFEKLHAMSGGSARVSREQSYDHCVDWFAEVIEKARIEDFTWHDLRHTFGSRCVMGGAPLPYVMKWMGHRSIKTTMRYAHLAPDNQLAEITKMLFWKNPQTNDNGNDTFRYAKLQVVETKTVTK